jgi:uncharacterized protein (TIGR00661 family)
MILCLRKKSTYICRLEINPMKIAFIVQSEGRGHLTQAIAMYQILLKNQHEVVGVFVGGSEKPLPDFFLEAIKSPIYQLRSPYLIFKGRELSLWATALNVIRFMFDYLKSLRSLHQNLKALKPDLILNFYEVLGGLHQLCYKPKAPMICIGHQYLLLHPDFEHPKGRIHRFIINTNSRITALKAQKMLALSFDKMRDYQQIISVPPLIRNEVLNLKTSQKDFLLIYITNAALAQEIIDWQSKNPTVEIVGFWNKPSKIINQNMIFNAINASLFLEKLSQCKGLVTTAGFESVCEAMYLNKPVMMVPVPNHYEQACNAKDAQRAGAGIASETFAFNAFEIYLLDYNPIKINFKNWVNESEKIFLEEIKLN